MVSRIIFSLAAFSFLQVAILYNARKEIMPYHEAFLKMTHAQAPVPFTTLLLTVMRVIGWYSAGIGVTVLALVWWIPGPASDAIACVLMALSGAGACVAVKTRVGGDAPWRYSAVQVILAVAGWVASLAGH